MRINRHRRGNTTLEFCLVGVPLIFIMISVGSICFGMFTLHTLQEAVEQGARYVITHGSTCSVGSNSCGVTIGTIADQVTSSAPGLITSSLKLTLIPNSGTSNQTVCNPVSNCHGNSTAWPPSSNSDNSVGNDITIIADFSYTSPIIMLWPGGGSSVQSSALTFHASSRQRLMF
jgi:Flp pilus assembly protein TadG